jgi:protein-L-isoaspartate O-methyltransferase
MSYTATYSPDDNKLRLYASSRLEPEIYERVKAAGFKWAPKQELFVAPMWTPGREDLLLELAGEIDDEDTSLVDRAAERSERFEGYSDRRMRDAESAREAVAAIADAIPLGQPILVGHHSERRARKDAERIETGMRKAVKMWRTSQYWSDRAAGALAHAKYKELPAVRARRIKGIESDLRKAQTSKRESEERLRFWSRENITLAQAKAFANMNNFYLAKKEGDREDRSTQQTAWSALDQLESGIPSTIYAPRTLEEVIQGGRRLYPRLIANKERWIEHYENRLVYERAMLAEQIGVDDPGKRWPFAIGGKILVRNEWWTILRINKSSGKILSFRVQSGTSKALVNVELVKDYQEPTEESVAKAKKAVALNPLCNYPRADAYEITKAQWDKIPSDYRGHYQIVATPEHGAHRVKKALGVYVVPKGDGSAADWTKRHSYQVVYVIDAKRVDPPAPTPDNGPVVFEREKIAPTPREPAPRDPKDEQFRALEKAAKAGVQIVTAPQLFETPRELAREVVELADIRPGHRVLEPSAGTGRLLEPLPDGCKVTAIEINSALAYGLADNPAYRGRHNILGGDFLEAREFAKVNDEWQSAISLPFDRIIMNPPFENGSDIKHIRHALTMLAPGGRLVAICADGPRQRDAFMGSATEWRDLPAGSFKESGTGVNAAIVIFDREG